MESHGSEQIWESRLEADQTAIEQGVSTTEPICLLEKPRAARAHSRVTDPHGESLVEMDV